MSVSESYGITPNHDVADLECVGMGEIKIHLSATNRLQVRSVMGFPNETESDETL